jgi:hypothetical protein
MACRSPEVALIFAGTETEVETAAAVVVLVVALDVVVLDSALVPVTVL